MLCFPTLEPHPAGARHAAVLPLQYPNESEGRQMARAHYNLIRHWPNSEDFQRQCDHLQVSPWFRTFLVDTHDVRMDTIARKSGFHAQVEFKKMAIAMLKRDRAAAVRDQSK